ncbi:SanA protein [Clostridiales Family XIII bacterium PM5-7]
MREIKRVFGKIVFTLITVAVICGIVSMTLNNYVVSKGKKFLTVAVNEEQETLSKENITELKAFDGDCILVLGAGIRDDQTPTPMLKDRLDIGIMLYKAGVAPKILLSGDNGSENHNEIHVMLTYTKDAGVPAEDIFCDHAGFSTYDSMYRAKNIFSCSKVIVATQTYHEYRALFIGDKLDLKVMGVASDQKTYDGQALREIREVMARVKDFFKAQKKPEATLGGDVIPIDGSGESSHGE